MRVAVLLILLLSGMTARATTLPRVLSLDVGMGVPVIANAEVSVLFAEHWQIGFGYGYVPGLSSLSAISVPTQTLSLNGLPDSFSVTPKLTASLDMLTPFLRFFPTERNWYFQLSYSILRMNMGISGTIEDATTGQGIGGVITGSVSVWQPIPTISMGHIFASKEFFVNLSLGVSFLMSPWVSVSVGGAIPDALGGTSANQGAITNMQNNMSDSIQKSVDTARQQITLIPSILISAGLFL